MKLTSHSEMPLSRSSSTSHVATSDSEMDGSSPSSSSTAPFSIPTISHQHPNRDSRRLPALPSSSMAEFNPSSTLLSMQKARTGFSPPQTQTQQQQQQQLGMTNWAPMGASTSSSSSSNTMSIVRDDPFHNLRRHNLATKEAWAAIPSSEGFKILDLCRNMSATNSSPVSLLPLTFPSKIVYFIGGGKVKRC